MSGFTDTDSIDELQKGGQDLSYGRGAEKFCNKLIEQNTILKKPYVVDSLRPISHLEFLA